MIKISLLLPAFIAFAAVNCQQYVPQQYAYPGPVAHYDQLSESQSNAEASANAYASSQSSQYSNVIQGQIAAAPAYGHAIQHNLAGTAVDPKAHTSYATGAYQANKGEILIHRPAPIIVKRPPTKVLVNHPPLVVRPAPVVLHKPPPVVLRKVYVKQHPRPVKVEPVYVNVVKPPAEKYFVNEKAAHSAVAYQQYQPQLAHFHSQSQSQAQAQAQAQSQSQS